MFDPHYDFGALRDSFFGYTIHVPYEAHFAALIIIKVLSGVDCTSLHLTVDITDPHHVCARASWSNESDSYSWRLRWLSYRNRDVLYSSLLKYASLRAQITVLVVNKSAMAMVGAAATATGVTQTLSTAILIVEMTGEFDVLILAMVRRLYSLLCLQPIVRSSYFYGHIQ